MTKPRQRCQERVRWMICLFSPLSCVWRHSRVLECCTHHPQIVLGEGDQDAQQKSRPEVVKGAKEGAQQDSEMREGA